MNTEIKIILPQDNSINIDLSKENLDWEVVEIDEREMGVERLYEAILKKEMDGLDEPLEITFRIWEYPEGMVNMQEIEVNQGDVVEECDLGQFVISYYQDDDYDDESES